MEEIAIPVFFFAKARELVGTGSASISIVKSSQTTGSQLLSAILKKYPVLNNISKNIVLAVNQEYIDAEQVVDIESALEIAVIPPISGG